MLCRLCLIDSITVLNIFEGKGEQLKIAEIIGQHFWFVPKKDDHLSNICCTCWSKVDTFHQFYCFIQDAQKKLSQITLSDRNSLPETSEIYLKEENNDDEWKCDTAVNEYVRVIQNNVETDDKKIKLENNDDDESSQDEFEEVNDPIHIDYTNQNNDIDSNIKTTTDNLIRSYQNKTLPSKTKSKISCKKKREGPKIRSRNASDSEEDLPLTHFVENKQKRDKNEKSEYLEKSKEKNDIIAKYMTLKCEICCEEFTTFAQIRQHYRTKHNKKGYVVCFCCSKKLYKRFLLMDHINRHLNPEYFKCDKCNKTFLDSKCLKSHISKHYSDKSEIFECDICSKKFMSKLLLSRHKFIHVPPEERQFTCDDCGKPFSTKYLLQTHRRYVHENAYGKMCHICAKVIIGKSMFEKHQLEHAGIFEPGLQCNKCGARLKTKYSLQRHMNLHNESSTVFKCEICGKIAKTQDSLRCHMRNVHESKRSHQCGICDKAFKRALTLKEHMATHTGEILYICPHCPQTFNSSANMHSHRKKRHRKEWEESKKDRGLPVNKITSNIISQEDNKSGLKEDCIETNSLQINENETNIDSTYNEQNLISLIHISRLNAS